MRSPAAPSDFFLPWVTLKRQSQGHLDSEDLYLVKEPS